MSKNYWLIILSFPLWIACSSNKQVDEEKKVATKVNKDENGITYNIPSPSEHFELISDLDGIKDLNLVNNPKNKYEGTKAQSLNFGVYIADVAYLTGFDETTKYLQFVNQLEKVGKELGITEVFTKETGDLVKKWSNNPDSLFKLSNESYTKSFQKLIDIDKGNQLCLMLAGGWIETMHLILGTSKGFGLSPKIDKFIVDQKLVAENLTDFMNGYKENKDVSEYLVKMGKILQLYNGMDCSLNETKVKENKGKINISGGETCTMNKSTYENLKKEIQALRSEIVN